MLMVNTCTDSHEVAPRYMRPLDRESILAQCPFEHMTFEKD